MSETHKGNGGHSSGGRKPGHRQPKQLNRRMQSKLAVLFVLVLLAFAVLVLRLYMINRNNGEEYRKQVLSQRSYDSREIPFKRGTISDRNGTVLATSTLVYNIYIDAYQMSNGPENSDGESSYLEPTLNAVERLGLDRDAIAEYVRQNPESRYYVVEKNVSADVKTEFDKEISDAADRVTELRQEIADEQAGSNNEATLNQLQTQLEEAEATNEEYSNIHGINFEEAYIRSYPNGTLMAHALGYATNSNEGAFGLEEYYNSTLNGTPGREYGYLNDNTDLERTVIEAKDGNNLTTTVDFNIQSIVEKYLKQFMDEHRNGDYHEGYGANNAACIIQNINTGEILAMASYPTYDPNDPYDSSLLVGMPKLSDDPDYKDSPTYEYLTQDDVNAMKDDNEQLSRYLYALWSNFCVSTYYEPGSTAKPFTYASGLESGKLTGDEMYYCGGSLTVDGWEIKCHNYKTGGDGSLTTDGAIAQSCNVALMQMALNIGKEDFCKFQRIFNFGLKTNIDLAKEARTDGLVYSADKMADVDLATNSFGQNFDVTMIQMITGFSSLINGGNYYEPHMVSKITSSSGATVQTIEPKLLKKTVSEETSAKIREACLQVVENGTGITARPAGYKIGGKTGTAETINYELYKTTGTSRDHTNYVVSFLGYAPADDPQIAIYVVVDRPNSSPQDYARYATYLTHDILTEVLPYLGIPMTEELTDEEKEQLADLNLNDTFAYGASNVKEDPVPIAVTEDTDDDGVKDAVDADGDGKPDTPLDTNGDGVTDAVDTNGDGRADLYDTNNDGVVDSDTPKEGQVDETQTVTDDARDQSWRSWEVDPETGFYIDPDNGKLVDPETGREYNDDSLPDDLGTGAASALAGGAADDDGNMTGSDTAGNGTETTAQSPDGTASAE